MSKEGKNWMKMLCVREKTRLERVQDVCWGEKTVKSAAHLMWMEVAEKENLGWRYGDWCEVGVSLKRWQKDRIKC